MTWPNLEHRNSGHRCYVRNRVLRQFGVKKARNRVLPALQFAGRPPSRRAYGRDGRAFTWEKSAESRVRSGTCLGAANRDSPRSGRCSPMILGKPLRAETQASEPEEARPIGERSGGATVNR
jgi:hypothetical protein